MKNFELSHRTLGPAVLASVALLGAGCGSHHQEKVDKVLAKRLIAYEDTGRFSTRGLVVVKRSRQQQVKAVNQQNHGFDSGISAALQTCAAAAISGGEVASVSYGIDDLRQAETYATYVYDGIDIDRYNKEAAQAAGAAIFDCIYALPSGELSVPIDLSSN